jgi:hypothetical protein
MHSYFGLFDENSKNKQIKFKNLRLILGPRLYLKNKDEISFCPLIKNSLIRGLRTTYRNGTFANDVQVYKDNNKIMSHISTVFRPTNNLYCGMYISNMINGVKYCASTFVGNVCDKKYMIGLNLNMTKSCKKEFSIFSQFSLPYKNIVGFGEINISGSLDLANSSNSSKNTLTLSLKQKRKLFLKNYEKGSIKKNIGDLIFVSSIHINSLDTKNCAKIEQIVGGLEFEPINGFIGVGIYSSINENNDSLNWTSHIGLKFYL